MRLARHTSDLIVGTVTVFGMTVIGITTSNDNVKLNTDGNGTLDDGDLTIDGVGVRDQEVPAVVIGDVAEVLDRVEAAARAEGLPITAAEVDAASVWVERIDRKASPDHLLVSVTITNRGPETARLEVLLVIEGPLLRERGPDELGVGRVRVPVEELVEEPRHVLRRGLDAADVRAHLAELALLDALSDRPQEPADGDQRALEVVGDGVGEPLQLGLELGVEQRIVGSFDPPRVGEPRKRIPVLRIDRQDALEELDGLLPLALLLEQAREIKEGGNVARRDRQRLLVHVPRLLRLPHLRVQHAEIGIDLLQVVDTQFDRSQVGQQRLKCGFVVLDHEEN